MCGSGLYDVRPIEMSYYDERSANRLEFAVNPESGIVMPPRGQWIEITGHWDDPASDLCPADADPGNLSLPHPVRGHQRERSGRLGLS